MRRYRNTFDKIGLKKGQKVAIFGCGTGEGIDYIHNKIGDEVLHLSLFGIICPILNAYYTKLFDIKYLASPELRHGSTQLNI